MPSSDIFDVAQRLGVSLRREGHELVGPCPRCGGKDRFAINQTKGVWNCRGCQTGGDLIALTRHVTGMTFTEALVFVGDERADIIAPRLPAEPRQRQAAPSYALAPIDLAKAAAALRLWREAVDPRGTVSETYLNSRGLVLDDCVAGRVLRWHPGAGCSVGLFRDALTGAPTGISRTFLSPDGRKIGRRFLGAVGGAAIQFDEATDQLTVAEGVETAMTARALGLGPTWACGSAGAIGRFPVIPGVIVTTLAMSSSASARPASSPNTSTVRRRTRPVGQFSLGSVPARRRL